MSQQKALEMTLEADLLQSIDIQDSAGGTRQPCRRPQFTVHCMAERVLQLSVGRSGCIRARMDFVGNVAHLGGI